MKKIVSLTLLVSLVLSSCGKAPTENETQNVPAKPVKTQTLKSDYFTESVKLIGRVSADKETTISSQTSGTIKTINAAAGKRVKTGEVLASIDFSTTALGASLENANTAYSNALTTYGLTKESIEKDLQNAKISLDNARTSKQNTYASTEKQLQLAQTQLDNILTQKTNTTKTTSTSLDLARKSRDNAKLNVDNFEKTSAETLKGLNDKKAGLYSTLKATTESALASVDSSLTQADLVLGVTDKNKTANDAYESYLGAKDPNIKTDAEAAFSDAKSAYDALARAKNFSNYDTSNATLANARAVVSSTLDLYEKLVTLLDNTVASTQFPQASLDALKTAVSTRQTALLSQVQPGLISLANSIDDVNNGISSAQTTINTTRTSLNTALNIAESNLANAEAWSVSTLDSVSGNETLTRAQLENTISTVKSARDSVDSALKMAEAQYESTRAKLQSQLTGVKTQTDASKAQKNIAGIQFDNGLIKAPFDGIIISKQVEVGGLVSPGTPVFSIGDDANFIVRMDVNSDLVSSLSLGQSVEIKRGDKSFSGAISLVSPGADAQSKMFRVEAKINNAAGVKESMNIGDYADVYVSKKSGDRKVLSVPFSALISGTQGDFIVYTVDDKGIAKAQNVKLGVQNSSSAEITSGLSEGDRVVVQWALDLQEGDKVEERK